MRIIGLALTLILFVSSCKTTKEASSKNAIKELNGSFKVSMLNGKDVSDKGLTFIIDESIKRVSGNSGCNTYGGGYELSETNQISFSAIFASKKYCAEQAKNDVEREYLAALSKKFNVTFKKESIELEAMDNNPEKISLVKE